MYLSSLVSLASRPNCILAFQQIHRPIPTTFLDSLDSLDPLDLFISATLPTLACLPDTQINAETPFQALCPTPFPTRKATIRTSGLDGSSSNPSPGLDSLLLLLKRGLS